MMIELFDEMPPLFEMCYDNRMVVQTRSGPKDGDQNQTKKLHCHHGRHYPVKQGGLWCSRCGNFYCTRCLEKYDVNTRNGPPSLWVCYKCQGTCTCGCLKPKPPRRNPKKKKTKESRAERRLKKELELKDAYIIKLKTTIEEGRILDALDCHQREKEVRIALEKDRHSLREELQIVQAKNRRLEDELEQAKCPFESEEKFRQKCLDEAKKADDKVADVEKVVQKVVAEDAWKTPLLREVYRIFK